MSLSLHIHTERSIQLLLMEWALKEKNHYLTLPNNRSVFRWECDLLTLTNNGLFHEYEIKLSLRDYENDFSGSKRKIMKHSVMGKQKEAGANYFWFVTSGFQPSWIPFYAGWIEVVGSNIKIMKPANRLHETPANLNQLKKCLRSLSFRLYNEWSKSNENLTYSR